jgi:enediyne biosynthesis protein E4
MSKAFTLFRLLAITVAMLVVLALAGFAFQRPEVRTPAIDVGVDTLAARADAQKQTVSQFTVFHQFRFEDRLAASGITFLHRIVDDAGINYKAVHYDHGNGMTVADTDGDGLIDIYFVNQAGSSELWKNLGGGKFQDVTSEAGVATTGRIAVSASFADVDNDGDQDLYVTSVRGGNLLFENDGRGRFKDVTAKATVGLVAHSSGSVFFDYNQDGRLDLLVCNVGRYTGETKGSHGEYAGLPDAFSGHMYDERSEYPVLYQNVGGHRFKDVTTAVKLHPKGWCGDAAVADLNQDGWPDLYVLNMMGANHYLENQQGLAFVDKTAAYFPKTSWGAMGIKFFDYDNDGRLDLFITDMHSDMVEEVGPELETRKSKPFPDNFLMGPADSFISGNSLYRNLGSGKFSEVSDAMGVENYWPWGPSIGDINADGWDDIFIASSMNYPFRYGINSMLLNNGGKKFLASEFLLGVEPHRTTTTPWFQLNCGKLPPDPRNLLRPMCENRTGEITVMSSTGSRSSALFDLDNDGDLDLVTSEFNAAPQVLVSNLSQAHAINWLQIKLIGAASNRDGLGALVKVETAHGTYTKQYDGKSGYMSQSSMPLYFGLGEDKAVTRVEVRWPSGRTQVISQGIKVNDTLRISEPR